MGDFVFPLVKPEEASMKVEEIKIEPFYPGAENRDLPKPELTLLEQYYESAKKLEALSDNRLLTNIPSYDAYWGQLKLHRELFNKLEEQKKYEVK